MSERSDVLKKEDYTYLITTFTKEVVKDRCDFLERRVYKFIENEGYGENVIVNRVLVDMVVIDYFADIARLKDFQGIERVNKNKITAYTAYWWLRRKPIQIVVNTDVYDEQLTFINEKFVATLLLKDFFDADLEQVKNDERYTNYMAHLLYYMKYRPLSSQALELMLATADVSKELGKISENKI